MSSAGSQDPVAEYSIIHCRKPSVAEWGNATSGRVGRGKPRGELFLAKPWPSEHTLVTKHQFTNAEELERHCSTPF